MSFCVVTTIKNNQRKVREVSKIWIENGVLSCPKYINVRNISTKPKANWEKYEQHEYHILCDTLNSYEEALAAAQRFRLEDRISETKAEETYRKKLKRRHESHPPMNQAAPDSNENNPNKINSIIAETPSKSEQVQTNLKKHNTKSSDKPRKKAVNRAILKPNNPKKNLDQCIIENLIQLENSQLEPIVIGNNSNLISETTSCSKDNNAVDQSNIQDEAPHTEVINKQIPGFDDLPENHLLPMIFEEVLKIKSCCASEKSKRIEMESRMQENFDQIKDTLSKVLAPLIENQGDQRNSQFVLTANSSCVESRTELIDCEKELIREIRNISEPIEFEFQSQADKNTNRNQFSESESESDEESVYGKTKTADNDGPNGKAIQEIENEVDTDSQSDSESISDGDSIPAKSNRETIKLTLIESKGSGSDNFYDEEGYLYSKNNVGGGGNNVLYLRCKNSTKYSCFARVTAAENNFENSVLTVKHNHQADKKFVDRAKFSKKLDENCKLDPFATAQVLYLRTKQQLLHDIDPINIPSQGSFDIERRIRDYLPKLPHSVDEFEELIAHDKYREHLVNDLKNLPFYRGVWTSSVGEKNVVYVSQTVLNVLKELKGKDKEVTLFSDGTHKVLPYHMKFRQLYIISIIYKGHCYPLAYILMEKKSFTSYDTVFANLKLLMPPNPVVKVMTDYESATRKALRKHYPEARMCGCFFHYVQAIMKNSKRFGLRDDPKFKIAIKEVAALALLPNQLVITGFHVIDLRFKNKKSQRWNKFKTYWLKQWAKANISVYGLVHRTNNFSESFNRNLNQLVKRKHPNLWVLLECLKTLTNNKSDEILQASLGKIHVHSQNQDMIRLNGKIENGTNLLDKNGNISDFLQVVTFDEDYELFVKDNVNMEEIEDDDNEYDEEVIPNDFNSKCDFRKDHPRKAANTK